MLCTSEITRLTLAMDLYNNLTLLSIHFVTI